MPKSLLTILVFVFVLSSGKAQLQVNKFAVTSGGEAMALDVKDFNGQSCAMIKITTINLSEKERKRLHFYSDKTSEIKNLRYTVGAIEFMISPKAEYLIVAHPDYSEYKYVFRELIQSKRDYVMELEYVSNNGLSEIESQWLVITPYPEDAMVYLDNKYITNGVYQSKKKPGTYICRVEAPLYHSYTDTIEITDNKVQIAAKLKPAFGYIQINSTPEQDAKVLIDGQEQKSLTPFTAGPIASGEHVIQVIKEMYNSVSQTITVYDNETTNLNVEMQANFATLTINTIENADIRINNEVKAFNQWQGRIYPGIYTLESSLDKHHTAKQDVELKATDNISINLSPEPICGSLDVITVPISASIYIDDKEVGSTPETIKNLLIGEHKLEIIKPGFTNIVRNISIKEDSLTEVSINLENDSISGFVRSFSKLAYIERTRDLNLEMTLVKGGSFMMGCNNYDDCEDDERPEHQVTLDDFYIGTFETTYAQWRTLMEEDIPSTKDSQTPVVGVSWEDVTIFIKQLNKLTGKKYRLPTEAEWEYAAKGGTLTKGYTYSGSDNLDEIAWYNENHGNDLKPVGKKNPNELGLYDMCGNVWEWCEDTHKYYQKKAQTNPLVTSGGDYRICRGGSYSSKASECRVTNRMSVFHNESFGNLGFRLVLEP